MVVVGAPEDSLASKVLGSFGIVRHRDAVKRTCPQSTVEVVVKIMKARLNR